MSEIVLLKNPLTGDSIQFVDGILRARIEFRCMSKEDFEKEMKEIENFEDEDITEQEAEALAKFLSAINNTLGANIQAGDFLKNSILNSCTDPKPSQLSIEDIVKEERKKHKKPLFQKIKDFFRKK